MFIKWDMRSESAPDTCWASFYNLCAFGLLCRVRAFRGAQLAIVSNPLLSPSIHDLSCPCSILTLRWSVMNWGRFNKSQIYITNGNRINMLWCPNFVNPSAQVILFRSHYFFKLAHTLFPTTHIICFCARLIPTQFELFWCSNPDHNLGSTWFSTSR